MSKKNTVEIILSAKDQASRVTKQALSSVQSSMQTTFGAIGRASAAAGTALAAAAGVASAMGIKYNANMERYHATLTTVLKSQDKATETLEWAKNFASKTPFELPGIVEATTKLEAYGLKAKDMLPGIGDMAAVMGKDINQAVEAVADAQTGELERLKEFGITKNMIVDQANSMGMKGIVNAKGQITDIAKFNEALMALMEERFKGGMDRTSKTFDGMMSNLKDNFNSFLGAVMEPVFNKIKEYLPKIIDYVNGINTAFKNAGWKGVMQEILPPKVADFLINTFNSIKATFETVNQKFFDNKEQISTTIKQLTDIISSNFKKIKEIISLVTEAVLLIWNEWGDEIIKIASILFKTVYQTVSGALTVIKGILNTFIGLFTGDWKRMGEGLKAIWTGLWKAIGTILSGTWKIIKIAFSSLNTSISQWFLNLKMDAIQWGKDIIIGLVKGFSESIDSAKEKAKEVAGNIASAVKDFFQIKSPSRLMKVYGRFVTEGLIEGMDEKKSDAQRKAEEIAQKVKDGIQRYISNIDQFADKVMDALRKKYEKQEQLQSRALDREIELARKATDAKLKLYDEEYAAKLKTLDAEEAAKLLALQSQIDVINNQTDAEEKALREQEYQKRLAELQKKMLDEESAEERAKIAEQLNEEISRHEREQLLESRRQQIENLREEMDLIREQADQKREQLKIEYDNKKLHEESLLQMKLAKFEEEKVALSNHYAALTTEEALQAEARKLFLHKDQQEIIELLNTYSPGWQDAGRTFGEKLIEGLNSKKESVRAVVNEMLAMVEQAKTAQSALSSSSGSSSKSSSSSSSKSYTVKSGDSLSKIADKFNTSVSEIAKANGISNPNVIRTGQALKIPGLYKGGNVESGGSVLVGERGPEILNLPRGAQVSPLNHNQEPSIYIQNITIPVKDLEEIKTIKDFFGYLQQTSRAYGGA